MARKFNFENFGNLFFYPGFKPEFFYFKSLLSDYEMNEPNPFYKEYANKIGKHARAVLNDIPGIGTEQKNKDDFLLDQLNQILPILNQAIEQERTNENKFIDDKIAMLKNNFDSKYISKNKDLAAITTLLSQLKTDEGINYITFINLLNVIEQGVENSTAIINFENKHLIELDEAMSKKQEKLVKQISGLATSRKKNLVEEEKMIQSALKKSNRTRVQTYLKKHSLKSARGFKSYMRNMTTADYKIADWISAEIQNILDNNYKTYCDYLIANKFNYQETSKQIRKELVESVTKFAIQNQVQILDDALKIVDVDKFCQDLVEDFSTSLDIEISGIPENFGSHAENKQLNFFKALEQNASADTASAAKLYENFENVYQKLKKKREENYTAEEKLLSDSLIKDSTGQASTGFYATTIKPVTDLIRELEKLKKQLEKDPDSKITFFRDKETKDVKVSITLQGKTSERNLTDAFSAAGLNLYKRGKLSDNMSLTSIITNMKTRASFKIRNELANIINNQSNTTKKQLEKSLDEAFQDIQVYVGGPEISELIQGFDKTWSKKIWTGPTNVKNDVIEVVVGMPNGEKVNLVLYQMLEGKNTIKSTTMRKLYQHYIDTFNDFQSQYTQAIQEDIEQISKSQAYTDYDAMAKNYFKTQMQRLQKIQELEEAHQKNVKELEKLIPDEKKRQRQIENLEKALTTFTDSIRNSLYVSSTMKTFSTYQNDLGFVGGDLGSTISSQIDSFVQLFEAAGVPINKELSDWLTFAVLNCSPVSVIDEENKDFIEKYLGGLAVFSLFNEGGAELTLLRQQLQAQELITTNNIMHLYRLNGIYYPGSFVLTKVVENVKAIIDTISQSAIVSANKNVMIYNPATYNMIPNRGKAARKGHKAKERSIETEKPWEKVGEILSKQVKIKVLFLAGLLDIVKELHKQMGEIELPN